ncbi:MAG TPA: hypothetical protein VM656_12005, partial [Pyrinomonadaceae bacterium]|nr:hypothetical protein [Pyrinomonadaceae bacterium]
LRSAYPQEAMRTRRSVTIETIKIIRFVSENPEEEFDLTTKGAFDVRGSKQLSVGGSEETLSDSNNRASISLEFTSERHSVAQDCE